MRARAALLALCAIVSSCRRAPPPAPRVFSQAEVQAAAHHAPDVAAQAPCKIQTWKQRPGAMIALCAPITGSTTAIVGPHVVLMEAQGERLVPVASGQVVLDQAHCDLASGDLRPSDEAPTFALDLASYTLAPGNTAIGVRFSCHDEFPAGEGEETRLYLFERSGAVLRQIFDQRIAWTNDDRASGMHSSGQGVVIVQAAAHAGHFDLLLRTTTTLGSLGSEPGLPRSVPARTSTQHFVWNRDQYAALPEP